MNEKQLIERIGMGQRQLVIEMLVFQEENEEKVNILHPLIPYVRPQGTSSDPTNSKLSRSCAVK